MRYSCLTCPRKTFAPKSTTILNFVHSARVASDAILSILIFAAHFSDQVKVKAHDPEGRHPAPTSGKNLI